MTQTRVTAGERLTGLRLFDVYYDKGIDPHRKSPAVDLTWQYPPCILDDNEVDSTTQNIVTSLEERFSATLRKQRTGALTKAEVTERLYEELGLNKREARELIELFFEGIRQALEYSEQIKLSGFDNSDLCDKHQCLGHNPKTGEEIPITARRVVTFRPGQKLRARVEAHVGTKL